MGWPTKGCGLNFNSNTGFAAYCGGYTKKVLMSRILCRMCRICEIAKRRNTPPNKHDCIQNYPTNGPSKSMEACAILDMVTKSPTEAGFVMHWIVSDDDSVMRAHCKYRRSTNKKDKGKLPLWIKEPEFKADPGHRKKTVAKKFYALANSTVDVSRVTSDMAKRLKKNWGYMIRQGKMMNDVDKYKDSAKAVLQHMYNTHQYSSILQPTVVSCTES